MTDSALTKAVSDIRIIRQQMRTILEECTSKQITMIPNGFANNLYWQVGHVVVSHASLLYRRCGQQIPVEDSYIGYFGKGSSPDNFDSDIPLTQRLLTELFSVIDQTETDMPKLLELKYPEAITVSSGHTLDSFQTALLALPFHDAYHLGTMKLLRKFV